MKVTKTELQQIIQEEAVRLKKRMMLENEKDSILKKLNKIQECEMAEETTMEEAIIAEAATEQEARQFLALMLKNSNTVKQIQANVNKVMALATAGTPPQWAAPAFQGKNLQDKAQYAAAYQAVYKLWSDAYVKYYMSNPKTPYNYEPSTNVFTPIKSGGTGLGFGLGTQHEE
jgi:hypothetical protein